MDCEPDWATAKTHISSIYAPSHVFLPDSRLVMDQLMDNIRTAIARQLDDYCKTALALTDFAHPKRSGWHLEMVEQAHTIQVSVQQPTDWREYTTDMRVIAEQQPPVLAHVFYPESYRLPI